LQCLGGGEYIMGSNSRGTPHADSRTGLVRDDDIVIHINDGQLVGWSLIATPFQELTEGPPIRT